MIVEMKKQKGNACGKSVILGLLDHRARLGRNVRAARDCIPDRIRIGFDRFNIPVQPAYDPLIAPFAPTIHNPNVGERIHLDFCDWHFLLRGSVVADQPIRVWTTSLDVSVGIGREHCRSPGDGPNQGRIASALDRSGAGAGRSIAWCGGAATTKAQQAPKTIISIMHTCRRGQLTSAACVVFRRCHLNMRAAQRPAALADANNALPGVVRAEQELEGPRRACHWEHERGSLSSDADSGGGQQNAKRGRGSESSTALFYASPQNAVHPLSIQTLRLASAR